MRVKNRGILRSLPQPWIGIFISFLLRIGRGFKHRFALLLDFYGRGLWASHWIAWVEVHRGCPAEEPLWSSRGVQRGWYYLWEKEGPGGFFRSFIDDFSWDDGWGDNARILFWLRSKATPPWDCPLGSTAVVIAFELRCLDSNLLRDPVLSGSRYGVADLLGSQPWVAVPHGRVGR